MISSYIEVLLMFHQLTLFPFAWQASHSTEDSGIHWNSFKTYFSKSDPSVGKFRKLQETHN